MHYLITEDMRRAAKLTPLVYKKLCKCAIIGTEIRVSSDKPSLGSVEENLLKVAAGQGIVNFGIDYLGRDKLAPNSAEKKNEAKGTPEEIKLLLDAVAKLCNAYEGGNREEMVKSHAELSALLGKEAINPVNAIRDDAMAKNINALLLKPLAKNCRKTHPSNILAWEPTICWKASLQN